MRIFNDLRQQMIKSKKLKNYIFYAIGEVILVVIGILIALWVNRSNEERKLITKTHQIGSQVLKQLHKDVKEIDSIIQDWDYERRVADTILRITKKGEPIPKECNMCPVLITGASIPTITDRVPKSIGENELYEGELLDLLTEIEFHYLEGLKMSSFYENSIIDFTTGTLKFWQNNYDWFAEFSGRGYCGDACKDYFYNSSDYKNRVAYYELILLDGYYYEAEQFKERNTKFITQLEEVLQ